MPVLTPEIDAELRKASSATIHSILVQQGLRNTVIRGVRPVRPDLPPMIGPALTLRYIPAREDIDGVSYRADGENLQRTAIDTIPEGYVFVIDGRGVADIACLGAILARRLKYRGCAGVVMDGGLRDTRDIASLELPAYSLGPAAPANYLGHHPLDIGRPIGCGGVVVHPEDIIFGDSEAAVVIPRHLVEIVAKEAAAIDERETFLKMEIESGKPTLGVYPPDEDTLARYELWKAAQRS
jgi:regulator of RNase E activity RraA